MARPARRADRLGLDSLASHWQIALDAAHQALAAAHGSVPEDELGRRGRALAAERQLTSTLLLRLAETAGAEQTPWLSAAPLRRAMLGLDDDIAACLFDLEGVLTDAAAVHAWAWGEAFDELLRGLGERAGLVLPPFDRDEDYRAYVEGRPRLEGVQTFLRSRGIQLPLGGPDDQADLPTVQGVARRKSEALVRRLDRHGVTALPGARRYLEAAGRTGLGRAVLSASVRAVAMLEQAGLAYLAEERMDADRMFAEGLRSRPAPDGLLSVCRRLDVEPTSAVAFTCSPLGVAAGRAAGVTVVGVGDEKRAVELTGAGAIRVVPSLASLLDVRLTAGV